MTEDIVVLGSTGSIGTQTLEVLDHLNRTEQNHFNIKGLACGTSTELLLEQIEKFQPEVVSVSGKVERQEILDGTSGELDVKNGTDGLNYLARFSEGITLINSLVGFLGLEPTLIAAGRAKRILLANKESLVIGGELVNQELESSDTSLVPIDSEHNAIFQALESGKKSEVERLIITASGGPFLQTPLEEIADATPEEALDHPNWDMGSRITCDSASMVNKGLEVIEAHWLFGLPYESIDPVVHPQSVVHSLVQFRDGSMVGELGEPNMKVPIQYALTYPQRKKNDYERTNLAELEKLEFRELDSKRYPAFEVVVNAGKEGGNRPAAINGADESLIKEFLAERIKFGDIARGLKLVLDGLDAIEKPDLHQLKSTDKWARQKVKELVKDGKIGVK